MLKRWIKWMTGHLSDVYLSYLHKSFIARQWILNIMNTTRHFNAVYAHLVEGKKGWAVKVGGVWPGCHGNSTWQWLEVIEIFLPSVCHHLIDLTAKKINKAPQSICSLTLREFSGVTQVYHTFSPSLLFLIYIFFTLPKDCTVQCNHSLFSLSVSSLCLYISDSFSLSVSCVQLMNFASWLCY